MTRSSRLRGRQSLRRKAGRKIPRSITLIVCEGKTEQEYFKAARIHYRLAPTEIVLAENTKGSAPISVVECAQEKWSERGSYDHIYCVFDRDGHESFTRAQEAIKTLAHKSKRPLPIAAAISIPCFEFWVLIHFERTDAPFDRCDVVRERIQSNHMHDYDKTDPAIARRLMSRIDDAIGNADWLEQRADNNNYNPYTNIHHVLRHFEKVASLSEDA